MSGEEELLRDRVRRYLVARREFQVKVNALAVQDDYRSPRHPAEPPILSPVRSAWAFSEWPSVLAPHVSVDHEAGPGTLADPPDVDWDHTVVLDISIRGSKAVVVTQEPMHLAVGIDPLPWTFQYRLVRDSGEWRIKTRWAANDSPPPRWIRHLL